MRECMFQCIGLILSVYGTGDVYVCVCVAGVNSESVCVFDCCQNEEGLIGTVIVFFPLHVCR